MYEYQFITIGNEREIINYRGFTGSTLEEHRELIQAQARQGWQFVAYVPTRFTRGVVCEASLVFERTRLNGID